METFIILELIPTSSNPEKGEIIQLSALKIKELKIIDRFDYRLQEDKVPFDALLDIISFDKENFVYQTSTEAIMVEFQTWIEELPLYIIDNGYTSNYLYGISNEKRSVFSLLGMEYHDGIMDELIEKYQLVPSNYIVDLLYESVVYEKQKER